MQKLLKTTKKLYFDTVDTKSITDNKTFYKTILPLFIKRSPKAKKLFLLKSQMSYQVIQKFGLILTGFFFANAVSNLNIQATEHSHSNLQTTDPILATVNSYDNPPNIKRI